MSMRVFAGLFVAALALLIARRVHRRMSRAKLARGSLALITGGGGGVGLELAKIYARAGCKVVLVGRNKSALDVAVAACTEAGAQAAHAIVSDISTASGTAVVGVEVARLYPDEAVRYLVLNAGAGAIAPFASDERYAQICEEMMNINFFANVRLLQLYLPKMTSLIDAQTTSSPSPATCHVLVMSSLAGMLPSILRSAYTASKHAIQGYMNALRGETPVPITLCCPGYVDTDFHQRVMTADGKPLPGHQRRGVAPAVCAQTCVDGVLSRDAEVVMTLSGVLGYRLRPWLTGIVDTMAKRKSLKSIQAK